MTATEPRASEPVVIPKIVSVDDHVVEPAHVWDRWLPAAYRDRGPRVERRGVAGLRHVGGGTYEQVFDDDAPEQADCWVYEDLVYIHKRHVAAVGYPRDEMTMTPMTYEEMRPGCYDPAARVDLALRGSRRDVAGHEVAEAGLAALQVLVAVPLGDLGRWSRVPRVLRHPHPAVGPAGRDRALRAGADRGSVRRVPHHHEQRPRPSAERRCDRQEAEQQDGDAFQAQIRRR